MRFQLVDYRENNTRQATITVKEIPDWLSWIFGARTATVQYIGWCKTWTRLPERRRAAPATEKILCDFWARAQWE